MPFTAKQRRIFKYFNGNKNVLKDPEKIQRRFLTQGFDFDVDYKLMLAAADENATLELQKTALDSYDKLLSAVRVAFDIPELEERDNEVIGLTEPELIDLMMEFAAWNTSLKKSTQVSQDNANFTGSGLPHGDLNQSPIELTTVSG